MNPLIQSLIAVIFITLISINLLYWLISRIPQFIKISFYLVSVAVGSLLGDAFFHLLPEANEIINNQLLVAILTILGILLFFSIEKFVRWHHCHDPNCQENVSDQHIIPISLTGESFHNFIDGVVIAGSFAVNPSMGVATTLAVLIHEIPQEIGDFAIYTHKGLSSQNALKLNLYSATFSLLGVIFTFLLGSTITNFSHYVIPITAGGFIYLASSDLIPELHRRQTNTQSSISQILLVVLGVVFMSLLLLLE